MTAALAEAEYQRISDLAWTEYLRVVTPARAEYERVKVLEVTS